MPSNDLDTARFDANLTRVLVLDAELVRREGRSVCLVIKDAPFPSDSPHTCLAEPMEASPSDEGQTSPTPIDPPAEPAPWRAQSQAQVDWLECCLVAWMLLVIVGLVVLLGFALGLFLPVSGVFLPLSASEIIILLIIMVLLFGRKLPETARYLGKGIVEFKKGISGLEDESDTSPGSQPERVMTSVPKCAEPPLIRRATVRYYNRMNPERVYPLLVLITRDLIEKVHKKHTDQRTSSPFAIEADTPVEIEPVLPGCDCYPPKVLTRLGSDDLTLTFRVVPRVLGKVDGAKVSIRQNHTSLAEIELDARVVKRTWVALSGMATFLLPGLSAGMKHFGMDFETQKDQDFSLYIAAARLVFDHCSPYALTALLAVATALLWWLTRPRMRDVFWDIKKVSPDSLPHQPAHPADDDRSSGRRLRRGIRRKPPRTAAPTTAGRWNSSERASPVRGG